MKKAELRRQAREVVRAPYLKVIQGEPEEGFLGEVPDLPGCFTAGESEEETLANLSDAMTAWVMTALDDGDPIPPPSSGSTAGPCLALRLSPDLSQRLRKQAQAEGVSQDEYAARLLDRALSGTTHSNFT